MIIDIPINDTFQPRTAHKILGYSRIACSRSHIRGVEAEQTGYHIRVIECVLQVRQSAAAVPYEVNRGSAPLNSR